MNITLKSMNTLPFGLAIINNEYKVQYLNDNFSKILQYSTASILNKNLELFLPYIKSLLALKDYSGIKKTRTSLGEEIAIELKYIPNVINDNILVFAYDFSNYELLHKQLNEFNEKLYLYQSMLNNLKDGIFITDDKGETLFVNDAFLSLSGLEKSDVIGKTVYYLMSHEIVPNSCCAKVLETNSPYSTLNNYYGGKSCLVSGSPIFDSNNNLKMVISVIRDISELEQLRQRLEAEKSLALSYETKLKELEKNKESELLISNSKYMTDIYEKSSKVANIDSSILILGETGVGKDFLANYIHQISKRSKGPFLKINCSAIPEHLLESELFGYEAGAFTGASRHGKAGLFESANNGTLFLDEIGDMPYSLQVKLLSAIQDKQMYRVGGNKVVDFNCRIIAATNANLEELVKQKKFRIDLYYRLNVININIPPLRFRKEDIIPLAMEFLNQFNKKHDQSKYFASRTLELFLTYDWPGNIREMKNLVERLVVISDKSCIEPVLFYTQILDKAKINFKNFFIDDLNNQSMEQASLKQKVESFEAHIIRETIDKFRTLKEASDYLSIDLSTLVRKKKRYNI